MYKGNYNSGCLWLSLNSTGWVQSFEEEGRYPLSSANLVAAYSTSFPLSLLPAEIMAAAALLSNSMARLIIGTGEEILYQCSCKTLKPISRLYFCRHCSKLRCPECVSHEVSACRLYLKAKLVITGLGV